MRLDLVLQNEGPYATQACMDAPHFEAMGYDGLWLTDHVIGVAAYAPVYGGNWLEILSTLTYLAGVTKKVRIGTGILVLPYRDPVLTAKMVATADVLSGGRVDLGVGTGWSRSEYNALGVGDLFEARGAVTDEILDVMLRCWQGGQFGIDGPHFKFRQIEFSPVPVQRPRVPIWVGARGLGGAPLRRAAKYADVWHPTAIPAAEVRQGGDALDAMAGRKVPRSIRFSVPVATAASEIVDLLHGYREVGCLTAVVDLKGGDYAQYRKAAEALVKAAEPVRKA